MTQKEIKAILEAHALWLKNDPQGKRADLSYVDLSGARLSGANLYGANLYGADLSDADLPGARLSGADLREANLCGANLGVATLCDADLLNADLRNADLRNASLRHANLCRASLCNANLSSADLRTARLCGASLYGANLCGTLLNEHDKIRKGIILKKPIEGYKKASNDYIITLVIPKGAVVFSINNDRCRTDKAKVISIVAKDGTAVLCAHSYYDPSFVYKVGEEIDISDDFDLMYNVECSTGIHFFRTREEAENYTP